MEVVEVERERERREGREGREVRVFVSPSFEEAFFLSFFYIVILSVSNSVHVSFLFILLFLSRRRGRRRRERGGKGGGVCPRCCLFSLALSLSYFFLLAQTPFFSFPLHFFNSILQTKKNSFSPSLSSLALSPPSSSNKPMQGWGALLGPEAPGDYYDGVVRRAMREGARFLLRFFAVAADDDDDAFLLACPQMLAPSPSPLLPSFAPTRACDSRACLGLSASAKRKKIRAWTKAHQRGELMRKAKSETKKNSTPLFR